MKEDKSIIPVPENIKIEWCAEYRGIHFGEDQCLWFGFGNKSYGVDYSVEKYAIPCKLIPCKREDLKAGDIGFRWGVENADFKELSNYSLFTTDDEAWHIKNDGGIGQIIDIPAFWWKVVPIEESL